MCVCTPNCRTPFCGKPGCEWPKAEAKATNDAPTPDNNIAIRELQVFISDWCKRHKFDRAEETRLLAYYLAGRLDVNVAMQKVLALPDEFPAENFGEPFSSPLDESRLNYNTCPKCNGEMYHSRLKGYRCSRCD